jgi:hypothetical protein
MMSDWEVVTEGTWRLELEDGYLYRVGERVAYVPCPTISQSLYDIAAELSVLKELFEETTFKLSGTQDTRAIRISDIG